MTNIFPDESVIIYNKNYTNKQLCTLSVGIQNSGGVAGYVGDDLEIYSPSRTKLSTHAAILQEQLYMKTVSGGKNSDQKGGGEPSSSTGSTSDQPIYCKSWLLSQYANKHALPLTTSEDVDHDDDDEGGRSNAPKKRKTVRKPRKNEGPVIYTKAPKNKL